MSEDPTRPMLSDEKRARLQALLAREGLGKAGSAITRRERFRDRKPADRRADAGFMQALWEQFGDQPFERGNLDAGRLSWLFGREVVAAEDPFDPESYDALLVIDVDVARVSFPDVFDRR